ncbi:PQQ-dependent sugar dehydrogenase [uncultured Croceitalea sp.]|uniref:PQQ-dependent sugar dehydrogenase n=1 Tax=uncultured Croceitalea sp. TaxID=1798908 RepID=UPI00330563DB
MEPNLNYLDKTVIFCVLFFCTTCLQSQISYEEAFPNINFNFPVEIQNSNDGSDRLFVVEQPGLIKVFQNSSNIIASEVSTFLDIESKVSYSAGQEIGLLGLAFHPNYNQNGYFYVYYTANDRGFRMVLARYQVSSNNPNFVDASTETILFSFPKNQSNSNHNGGKIAFGPDGYLYASIGDGGGGGDPRGNAQNITNAFGSILRIDVDLDGSNPVETNPELPNGNYEIPNDNPRVGQSGLDELYAWGIRNTWKFSFDGDLLYGADVGQNDQEEINIIVKGGNYGWNRFEGTTVEDATTSLITNPDIKPIFTYNRLAGDVSVTGGYVYKGSIINTDIQGKYIYGDYVSGRVWALDYDSTTSSVSNELLFKTSGESISSFGVDEAGELFFSDYGNNVKIYKIIDGNSGPSNVAVNGVGEWLNVGFKGTNGSIATIVNADGNNYYVGGDFTEASGISVQNLAKFNKTDGWSAFGSGTNGKVNTIAISSNGNVYVGGEFTEIDGVSVSNVAFWDGLGWNAMNGGTNGPVAKIGIDSNDMVYVGGTFETCGSVTVNNIGLWSNNSWTPLADSTNGAIGTNNEVRAITFDENDVLHIGGNFDSAGGNSAPRIATWNGNTWGTLGQGTSGFVQAILVLPDYIYAGGNFAIAGSETVNRIARWNRNTSVWEALNFGLSGSVNDITFDGTYVYACGNFETASNNSDINEIMRNIARWNDIEGWEALGPNTMVGTDNIINTLAFSSNNNSLFAGGSFTDAGQTKVDNIAEWNTIGCNDTSLTIEYNLNGTATTDTDSVSVDEDAALVLGISEDLYFTITLPDNTVVIGTYDFGSVTFAQRGVYRLTSFEGCSKEFEVTVNLNPTGDEDGDGVLNGDDDCLATPNGETVDINGCAQSQLDDDNDGISNAEDQCADTPLEEAADENGCAPSQLDDDNDGISNADDICANTTSGENVNAQGCADSQLDDDNDGVSNANDLCPNTPTAETVDIDGCGPSQLDDDNDGVSNADDICQNTPSGESADVFGCGESQKDIDNDGVPNADDLCNSTPEGETVNEQGCSETELDDDNDGIFNSEDLCPETLLNTEVDATGCEILGPPPNNFVISTLSTSCRGVFDGQLTIDAEMTLNYTARLTSVSFAETRNFTDIIVIDELPAGTYQLCLTTSEYESYESCSTVIIQAPEALNVVSDLNKSERVVTLEMNGGTEYYISLNDTNIKTSSNKISLKLTQEINKLKVSTGKDCQGSYEETISISNGMLVFPNPIEDRIFLNTENIRGKTITLYIYNISGKEVLQQTKIVEDKSEVTIDASSLASGMYILKLVDDSNQQIFKLVKR